MKPSKGRIVIVRTIEAYNGSHEHPAIITRAWSDNDTRNGPSAVNLTVLPDQGAPFPMSSVMLWDSEALAVNQHGNCAWWPTREGA